MKSIKLLPIFILFLLTSTSLYSQIWKQLWDSANAYYSIQNFDKAIELFKKSKDCLKTDSNGTKSYAFISIYLGTSYGMNGQYQKAESVLAEAKEIVEKFTGPDDYYLHVSYDMALGLLYYDLGQYKKAEVLLNDAKEIIEILQRGNLHDYISILDNLASIYAASGEVEKSEQLYLLAKKVCETTISGDEFYNEYSAICINLSNIYQSKGQNDKALSIILEAKEIVEKKIGKNNRLYAACCQNLSKQYLSKMEFEKAESFGLEAKRIFENIVGKENDDYTNICLLIGYAFRMERRLDNANEYYLEAVRSEDAQIKKIFRFTSEEEKRLYLRKIKTIENQVLSFFTSSHNNVGQGYSYDLFLSRRNLILSSSQQLRQAILNTDDTNLRKKYNAWINVRMQISFWDSKPIARRPSNLNLIEENANNLEKELSSYSPSFNIQNITWEQIQQNLKPNEAAIEFVDFESGSQPHIYAALLLRKDRSEPEIIKLFLKEDLDSILLKNSVERTENISTLYKEPQNGSNYSFESLYDLIWRPMEDSLQGITKIYFAPSGDLHKIAFAALPTGNDEVLSDKYQLVQLNTTASITDQVPSFITTTDNIQLYGGIQYDADSTALKLVVNSYAFDKDNIASRSVPDDLARGGTFSYLAGTENEVEAIKEQSEKTDDHVNVLSGINATEESFKALNGKASPAVIHIATHGFFFPDPKEEKDKTLARLETSGKIFKQSDNPLFRSGLAFAGANYAWRGTSVEGIEDGILTAYEVSNMYLPNTKLVVLSACETALGDIEGAEGVYGLQRAFKIAGVKNLVMSLWKVPDNATAEFMQTFYENLFVKQSVSDAFYHAQTAMKNKYRDDPYKWAAWILIR